MKGSSRTAHLRFTPVAHDGPMRTTPAPAAVATLAALALAACGSTPAADPPDGPIVLSSAATSGTPAPAPSASPTSAATLGAAPVVPDVRDHDAEVDVRDQAGDGTSVVVEEVVITVGSGHLVVVDPTTRGVLGTTAVPAGTRRGVTVALTTPVPRSGEYLVVLHADDGDGRFDATRDALVVDADDDGGDDDGASVGEDFRYTLR